MKQNTRGKSEVRPTQGKRQQACGCSAAPAWLVLVRQSTEGSSGVATERRDLPISREAELTDMGNYFEWHTSSCATMNGPSSSLAKSSSYTMPGHGGIACHNAACKARWRFQRYEAHRAVLVQACHRRKLGSEAVGVSQRGTA